MSSGGPRAGAGRPRKAQDGSDDELTRDEEKKLPLDYMLEVMNDPNAEPARRDRMANWAAPYLHQRAGDATGKKAEREAQARVAQNGTEWEDLLQGPKPLQ